MAADIRAAVDHAEHLIGALLILARNERGLTVHDVVDLATVVEDVVDTATLNDLRIHSALKPAVISGDPVLLERLVANLVDNAARYNTAAGDIWISTSTVAANGLLTVESTGPLIGSEDAERIFQPFQRLNDRTSHEGFGLGLTIVASIAAVHSGRPPRTPGKTADCRSASPSLSVDGCVARSRLSASSRTLRWGLPERRPRADFPALRRRHRPETVERRLIGASLSFSTWWWPPAS